jgi:hypothetical protein
MVTKISTDDEEDKLKIRLRQVGTKYYFVPLKSFGMQEESGNLNGAGWTGNAVAEWTAVSMNSDFIRQNHKIAARPEVDA